MSDDDRVRRFPLANVRAHEFYETARRLQNERSLAPRFVDTVLRETPRSSWLTLVERADLLTCGAVEYLCTLVSEKITHDLKYAEALANLATALADAIPGGEYPAVTVGQIRASAWKSLGNVLAALARYDSAVESYTRAGGFIEEFPLAHDQAVIRLNLAITYLDTERFTEAFGLLAECERVFKDHGDTNLTVLVGFYEGLALHRTKKYREARETYLLLLASSTNIEKATLAALHQSIGYCSTELGDYAAAEDNLSKALALRKEVGQTLDALKVEHYRGILLLRRGLREQGITHLRWVRHQYLKASLAEEAGLCGLEIVGAMLSGGEPDVAEALARTIMNEFLAASLNTRAITALGYLSEAIAEKRASPELAGQIQAYVLSLRSKPEREFPDLPMLRDAE